MREGHIVTPVSGRENARKVRKLQAAGSQGCIHGLLRTVFKTDAGFAYIGSDKLPLAVNDCDFGGRSSDIHSAEKGILAHLPFFSASCSMKASMLVRACSSE